MDECPTKCVEIMIGGVAMNDKNSILCDIKVLLCAFPLKIIMLSLNSIYL